MHINRKIILHTYAFIKLSFTNYPVPTGYLVNSKAA